MPALEAQADERDRGGKRLAKKWGTLVMDNEENDLTAAMASHPRMLLAFTGD